MKQIVIIAVAAIMALASCNNGNSIADKKDAMAGDKMAKMDSGKATAEKVDAPVIKASFTNVNADVAAHIKEVTGHYFHIKHALTKDDATDAKNGATMLLQAISQFDNSLLPADQKAAYTTQISAIKEHADAIVKSSDAAAERIHFSELSAHMYDLVKAFGAGQKVYYDHCPMAFDNKGANWLSEGVAIQNPYLGAKMPDCGTVEQVIE